jgi:proteic killer suppression protein
LTFNTLRHILSGVVAILSFKDADTEAIFNDQSVLRFRAIQHTARRKLMVLDAATDLRVLAINRGNHLEILKGDRAGQYSIRINDQWRICFFWKDGDALNVEIIDYH